MTTSADGPMFSVIVPLEFHRGQARTCLEGWARHQTYPRDRYEILLAAPHTHPADDLDSLRAILTPHDRVLVLPDRHDMPLVAEAARQAKGDALFFTESHCWPEPDTLREASAVLGAHAEWAGFSGRSRRVTHNRLSVVEADLYEADIAYGMQHSTWRRILDQCFVVRREAYFAAGGFDASLGHFAEWMLAARFHRAGLAVGYAPNVVIHHYYIGEIGDWRDFTRDFVRGEMRAYDRGDAVPFADLFDPVPEWQMRSNWDRRAARRMLRLIARDVGRHRPQAVDRDEDLSDAITSVVRWWPVACGSARIAGARSRLAEVRLAIAARLGTSRQIRRTMLETFRQMVHAERLRCLAARGLRDGGPSLGRGAWNAADETGDAVVGLHAVERWNGLDFRWSEPAAMASLPLDPGQYEVIVQWLPIRPAGRPARPRFYVNERAVGDGLDVRALNARFAITVPAAGQARIGWVSEPLGEPRDPRRLGLPISRIGWRPVRLARPRPLLLLHIRKTAGSALRDLIVNRFDQQRCLLQAHAKAVANEDLNQYDFVTGHIGVGHVRRFLERPLVATVLREPVDRALSTFYFFRENDAAFFRQLEIDLTPEDFAERVRFTTLANEMSCADFLAAHPDLARRHMADVHIRSLLDGPVVDPIGERHLAEAKATLTACDVVGLTERLDDTIACLEHTCGWEGVGPATVFNKTRNRKRVADEDPRVVARLAEWNRLDAELYRFAETLLSQRMAALRADQSLDRSIPDAAPRPLRLPDAASYTFGRPIHGRGWHTREHDGTTWICWTGREPDTWVDLALADPVPSYLTCRVRHIVSREALDSTRVLVNGHPVALRQRHDDGAVLLEGNVPSEWLYRFADRVRVAFDVPGAMSPHDADPTHPEHRRLGLALSAIELRPLPLPGRREVHPPDVGHG